MYDEEEYITDKQRKEYQDIFDQFDKEKDGAIGTRELANVLFSRSKSYR